MKEKTTDDLIEELEKELENQRSGKKRLDFVRNYVQHFNASKAGRHAGYSEKSVASQVSDILRKPKIKSLITLYQRQAVERMHINQDKILSEYAHSAFSNIADFIESTEVNEDSKNSSVLKWTDLTKLPREQLAAVRGIKISEFKGGKGGRASETKIEISFHDKHAALEAIGKHLNFFGGEGEKEDKVVINITGQMGGLLEDDGNLEEESEED